MTENLTPQFIEKDTVKKTVSASLCAMEVGEVKSWPISKMTSVRSLASQAGALLERVYRTQTNRETREIVVKRIS